MRSSLVCALRPGAKAPQAATGRLPGEAALQPSHCCHGLCVQGANRFCMSTAEASAILTDISNLAAFDSLVMGELPPMSHADAENLLASFGLLGAPLDLTGQPGGEQLAER